MTEYQIMMRETLQKKELELRSNVQDIHEEFDWYRIFSFKWLMGKFQKFPVPV